MARKTSAGRVHKAVAEEAGFKRLSLISVLAGTVTGYGSFAVLAAIVGAILSAADVDTDFSTNDWASTEALSGIATAITLLLAYLFGGYVAGRMARRSGALHGAAVFVLGLLGGVLVGALVAALGDDQDVEQNLRSIGVPTTADEWGNVGMGAAAIALVLMAVGSILGGTLGERWHTKLARRAADPEYGPEARARREAERLEGERDEHIDRDDLVRRDRDDLAEQAAFERERNEAKERDAEERAEITQRMEAEKALEVERERGVEEGREAEQERELARQTEEAREAEAAGGAEVAPDADRRRGNEHRVVDVRNDDPEIARASGTTEDVHGSGRGDEPRYTATEWAELQERERATHGNRP